jgi:hypothetical protein
MREQVCAITHHVLHRPPDRAIQLQVAVTWQLMLVCTWPGSGAWPDFDGPLHSSHVSEGTDALASTADQVALKAAFSRMSR